MAKNYNIVITKVKSKKKYMIAQLVILPLPLAGPMVSGPFPMPMATIFQVNYS